MPRILRRLLLLLVVIAAGPSRAPAQVGHSLGVIDPNVAAESDLLAVPGLNPAIVKSMLDSRPFMSMAEFDAFLGRVLDRDQRRAVYLKLFVPINVNSTTDEEWRLVPGIGAHMLLDFKTTRPFGSLASFRQEIGKYLPSQDAERVTQYVFVPLDANTASDDELRTIPGLTPKVLEAIKRHRPYRDLAAVSTAIRKTTSAKEAARISRFFRTAATP